MPGRFASPIAPSASCLTRVQRIIRIFFSSPRTGAPPAAVETDAGSGRAGTDSAAEAGAGAGEEAALRAEAGGRRSTRSEVTRPYRTLAVSKEFELVDRASSSTDFRPSMRMIRFHSGGDRVTG